jgi:homeobox protein EMX
LVRPSALAAGIVSSPGFTPTSGTAADTGLKGLYLPEPLVHPGHHHHSHHHPHHHHQLALAAAAAQHFQAAGLAAALAQQTAAGGHHGAGFLPGAGGAPPGAGAPGHLPPHHPTPHPAAAIPRDTYPLYPWLLSRHGRIFPHRFPAG